MTCTNVTGSPFVTNQGWQRTCPTCAVTVLLISWDLQIQDVHALYT